MQNPTSDFVDFQGISPATRNDRRVIVITGAGIPVFTGRFVTDLKSTLRHAVRRSDYAAAVAAIKAAGLKTATRPSSIVKAFDPMFIYDKQ